MFYVLAQQHIGHTVDAAHIRRSAPWSVFGVRIHCTSDIVWVYLCAPYRIEFVRIRMYERDCDTAHTHRATNGRGTHSTNSTNSHLFLHFANVSTNTVLCSFHIMPKMDRKTTRQSKYTLHHCDTDTLTHSHTHTHSHALESVPQASKSNAMCQRTTAISMLHNAAAHFPFNLRDPVKCAHHTLASTESFAGTKPVHRRRIHTNTTIRNVRIIFTLRANEELGAVAVLVADVGVCWWIDALRRMLSHRNIRTRVTSVLRAASCDAANGFYRIFCEFYVSCVTALQPHQNKYASDWCCARRAKMFTCI